MTTRVCGTCKVEKPFDAFHKDAKKKHGIRYDCKECNRKRIKKYDDSPAGKKRMRVGHWKKQNIDISFAEYTERYSLVGGKCEICGTFMESLCVDHNHKTGAVRGLLCKPCNIGLSALKENSSVLKSAIFYLKRTENGK